MKVICVIDKNYGMLFNHRRIGQDRGVRQDIYELIDGAPLFMSPYSGKMFADDGKDNIFISENYLQEAGEDDYVFVEEDSLQGLNIDTLILYRFDRLYPADTFLSIAWKNLRLCDYKEFAGYSHEKIEREIYQ